MSFTWLKVFGVGDIILDHTILSLFANIFEIILHITLHKLTGLKSIAIFRELTLGILKVVFKFR